MRINKYSWKANEDKTLELVKDSSCNYLGVDKLDMPEKIAEMMRIIYKANNLPEEYVWVAALSSKSKLIGMFEVSHGTATSSLINPKEIFSRLCLCGAVSFIIIHNHPSGDSKPSEDDMKVTKRLKECANLMGIKMLDHIIIGDTYYSIYENGYAF